MSLPKDAAGAGIAWQYFDERAYISAGALRPGENAYARNKFNQEASYTQSLHSISVNGATVLASII